MVSAVDAAQVISAVAAPLIAIVAIAANVWISRQTLNDRDRERLWRPRADLYLELVRLVEDERKTDIPELLMHIDALDHDPSLFWQSSRDRDNATWRENDIRVLAYASDEASERYSEWNRCLYRLAGLVHPERVTGSSRPVDMGSVVTNALDEAKKEGNRLIEQIRSDLGASRENRHLVGRLRRR
jgi:hypothetical protein